MEQKDKRDALMNREILQKIASLEERVKTAHFLHPHNLH